jgi:epidermal growth factor receptor substrate 15
LFEKSGVENGLLSGVVAKQIFEKARLPNEVLGRIWNLSDTQAHGALDTTEFIIAMHLLASYKSGVMRGVPNTLPPGLYEAASRRPPIRTSTGSRPTSSIPPASAIPPQFSGFGSGRPQSPVSRQQVGTPLSAQSTGDGWLISPAEKARFDQVFATLDKSNRGFITGEQAVPFFTNARLPEEILAQIWDLADINSEGQLNGDEFAVAMYLIRQQRGSKDARGNLPPTLPPALVPPSMRRQQAPPSQPTAPAFENTPITQPRSAADDLFGLDAFSTPAAAQAPQTTGSSVGGPFQTPRSPPPPAAVPSPGATSSFKPFVPSSSFGQSIVPQGTGVSGAQSRPLPPQTQASDDLLGDADPEISQKLTSETTELANLSNQVGNLSKQMTEVHGDRAKAEQELAQSAQQKRDFETRLTQLRAAYEQEVKDVKALQDRLAASRVETKRLQQDMAIIDGSHQDLQTQHQQISSALEADQRENASLKEKIRNINAEVSQLRPLLEKLRSDARQQKGLVAINRKQLATNEAERDRLQAEKDAAAKELEEATKEAEQTAREAEQARSILHTSIASPALVASPTPSTSSNPFFRRVTTGPLEPSFSPSPANQESSTDTRNAFDSIFGPSFPASSSATPPPVSFRSETPTRSLDAHKQETRAVEHSSSPRLSSSSLPDVPEPPAPPQAGQITSAALPFRAPLSRGDSVSSSVRVAPPASRISPAGTPGIATPEASTASTYSQTETREPIGTTEAKEAGLDSETSPFEQSAPPATDAQHDSVNSAFGPATNQRLADIPGAFPSGDTPRSATPQPDVHPTGVASGAGVATVAASAGLAAAVTHEHDENQKTDEPKVAAEPESSNRNSNFDNFFGGPARPRSDSEKAADLNSAFSALKKAPVTNGDANMSNKEFPPIRELEAADESDDSSEAPMTFDDNFNTTSPPRPPKVAESERSRDAEQTPVASPVPSYLQSNRPPLESTLSAGSSLPGVEAQTSPPKYEESEPHNDPAHFPPEFKGLLARREDPTSSPPPTARGTTSPEAAASHVHSGYGPEHDNEQILREQGPPAAAQRQITSDDFDSAFANMTVQAAPVEDDEEDEDEIFPSSHNAPTDFDPTFDSPRQSKSTKAVMPQSTSIHSSVTNGQMSQHNSNHIGNAPSNLSGFGSTTATANTTAPAPSATPPANTSHDWDAIFAGLDTPAPAAADDSDPAPPAATLSPSMTSKATAAPASASTSPPASQLERPALGRALTTGTEHDDPILKRLTAMGWSRDESLAALEKFDYNIDKVRA